MRFFGCIFNDSQTFCFYGSQHNINGSAYRHYIHINIVTCKLLCLYIYHTAIQTVGGSQGRKAFQMLVDRSYTKITAARHGNHSMMKTAQ